MSKDLQILINQKVKFISPGLNSTNLCWPAKTSTTNYTKIITFKPTIQNPTTKINKPTILKTKNNLHLTNTISQVTNDPDIDEYTTDI